MFFFRRVVFEFKNFIPPHKWLKYSIEYKSIRVRGIKFIFNNQAMIDHELFLLQSNRVLHYLNL
jgi:hypothetical protein